MSELTERLTAAGQQHRGTDLGGLLQWAALHIAAQDEALAEDRESSTTQAQQIAGMEDGLAQACAALESALQAVRAAIPAPLEFARDLAPHINLMHGHGDPDYTTTNGKLSCRHIDLRETKPRKARTTKEKTT